jgi:hypothetical protein
MPDIPVLFVNRTMEIGRPIPKVLKACPPGFSHAHIRIMLEDC